MARIDGVSARPARPIMKIARWFTILVIGQLPEHQPERSRG